VTKQPNSPFHIQFLFHNIRVLELDDDYFLKYFLFKNILKLFLLLFKNYFCYQHIKTIKKQKYFDEILFRTQFQITQKYIEIYSKKLLK